MRSRLPWLGVVVGLAVDASFFLSGGEAGRVRARVTAAAEALSGQPGEGDLDRLARLAVFVKSLAPDVVVEADAGGPEIRGRDAVAAVASRLAAADGPLRIELSDLEVEFDDMKSRATVTALAHVTSTARGATSSIDGDVVRIDLVKAGDDWLIGRATAAPVLAR